MLDSNFIKKMNESYNKRLDYFLNENDIIKDKHGNNYVELARGLKVRNKKSGLRFTVFGYEREGNEEYILLLKPDVALPDLYQKAFLKDDLDNRDDIEKTVDREINIKDSDIIKVNIKDFDNEYERKG